MIAWSEQEAIDGAAAYRPGDFMADVRKGIWSEIEGGPVHIDVYRRNLQNSYIDSALTEVEWQASCGR